MSLQMICFVLSCVFVSLCLPRLVSPLRSFPTGPLTLFDSITAALCISLPFLALLLGLPSFTIAPDLSDSLSLSLLCLVSPTRRWHTTIDLALPVLLLCRAASSRYPPSCLRRRRRWNCGVSMTTRQSVSRETCPCTASFTTKPSVSAMMT